MLQISAAAVAFGEVKALDGLDLVVPAGEVLGILGPSGCGKSTLLRAVAGLQPLDEGTVSWDGENLEGLAVHRRDFGLMFQEHALFPHRDVATNIDFGLRMQKMPAVERRRRVTEVLAMVGLAGFGERQIHTLSGGEAQRVALARSLAAGPRLLMLDEPLGSLDRPRRDELTEELRVLLRRVNATVLHVTHDHDEAFAIADRVAVMQAGRVARIGAPADVWHDPRSADVARFLGHVNVVQVGESGQVPWGRLQARAGCFVLRADGFRRLDQPTADMAGAGTDADDGSGSVTGNLPGPAGRVPAGTLTGTVTDSRFRGDRFELRLRTDPGAFELVVRDRQPASEGDLLRYSLDASALIEVEPEPAQQA